MSKNYELLQQAELSLGGVPTFTTERNAVGAERQTAITPKLLTVVDPEVREESLKLVQRLFLTPGQTAPKVVTFAPIESKNGCSWLCALAARVLSESAPKSVCLVEGNFRAPSLTSVMGMENHHGLVDSLRQEGAIRRFAKQIGPDNLWLLSCGALSEDSLNLLNSNRMKERVDELRREFDHVVIDAPPLNAFAEGIAFGRLADGVVLVLEADETRREIALRATESLRAMKIPVLGAVLNNRTFPIPAALYKRL